MKISTTVNSPYKLGQVLQQCRMQRNINQRQLAAMLSTSQKWVWEMEQGKPGLLMTRLFEMMEILGITFSVGFEVDRQENTQTAQQTQPDAVASPAVIADIAFCMQLADACGLTQPGEADTIGNTREENFNQVLGTGTKAGAKKMAQFLTRFGRADDTEKLAMQLIFALAIGNLDMHAKNIGILHFTDNSIMLAPISDRIILRHHKKDDKLIMAVNGKNRHADITISDIAKELASWEAAAFPDVSEAAFFTQNCLVKYMDGLNRVAPDEKVYPNLVNDISSFITNLLWGNAIGGE